MKEFLEKNSFAIYVGIGLLLVVFLLIIQISRSNTPEDTSVLDRAGSNQSLTLDDYKSQADEFDGEVIVTDSELTPEEFLELKEELESEDDIDSVEPSGELLKRWTFEEENAPMDDR